jgi:5-methylcytosine-specific restriction endonuclease McrA
MENDGRMDGQTKRCTACLKDLPIASFPMRVERGTRRSQCRRCAYDKERQSPNVRWTKLAYNLARYGHGRMSPTYLRENLGEPATCYLCGGPIPDWQSAEIDHIEPLARGGVTTLENLRWTHRTCNRMKHDLTIPEFTAHIARILAHLSQHE